MCACLVVLIGAAFPRIALVLMWIFGDMVDRAFDGWALPLLGIIFLPYTTFFYVLAYAPIAGVSGIGWFFVAFGFILDLSSYFGGSKYRQGYPART
jgi:hypothetical protein